VHFVPAHLLQPAFAEHARALPVTERLYHELLPLYADLAAEDLDRVLESVARFFGLA
jgi:dTDP-4-amino-4,6-dideoxygalactose transaminase